VLHDYALYKSTFTLLTLLYCVFLSRHLNSVRCFVVCKCYYYSVGADLCDLCCLFVCLLFICSVCGQNYCKSIQPIFLETWCYMIGPTNCKNFLIFDGGLVLDTDSGSLSTSVTITKYRILRHLLQFLIQSTTDFHDTQ